VGSYASLMDTTSQDRIIIDAANASFPPLSHHFTFDTVIGYPPPVIMTAQSCLLIPAAFIAWWYWTKRTTKRMFRGFLTFARGKAPASVDITALGMSEDSVFSNPVDHAAPSPSSATTDEYQDLYDGLTDASLSDSSTTFRFIRWLKGTKSSRVRHKVRTATRKNLRGSPIPPVSDATDHAQNPNPLPTDAKVSGNAIPLNSATYEDIVAVELCSLEESSTVHLPSKGPERAVRVTVETIPFGEYV
jgi:hypothetical protein